MSKRFELINFLNAHDNFKDNKNNKKLDSFDVVKLLNDYDKLQTLLVEKDQQITELQKQLKTQPSEIVENIKKQIFNHFNVKNMEEYENLSLIDSLFTADAVIEMLDTILKEYQK